MRENRSADEIGAEDVGPLRRLVEVGEVHHRAAVQRKRRDEIREHRRQHDKRHEDQAEQRQRIAQQDGEGALHDALCE